MSRRSFLLVLLSLVLALLAIWAMTIGPSLISLAEIGKSLWQFDGSRDHLVIATVRLPRVATAILVGAALAVAGAVMQAVTANPLASPGILGVNAGAAFAVVIALIVFGSPPRVVYVWFAFAGAAGAAVIVYVVASTGAQGATPVKLALSGAIFATFLGSVTTALLIYDANTLSAIRLWTAGSLAAPELQSVATIAPYTIALPGFDTSRFGAGDDTQPWR